MAKKRIWMGMSALVLAFGLMLSGCATNVATPKSANFEKKPIVLAGQRQYEVLGPVTITKDWKGILGLSLGVPQLGMAGDFYLWQNGGVTYVDLFNEAKKMYPDVDAIVDINVDYIDTQYFVFYSKRDNVVNGIAIRYVKRAEGSVFPPESKN